MNKCAWINQCATKCTKRVSLLALTVAFTGAGMLLGGCEGKRDAADRQVNDKIAAAQKATHDSNGAVAYDKAQSLFDAAVTASTDASPATQVRAKLMQGENALAAATAIMADIDRHHTNINRLTWEIAHLGQDIKVGSSQIASWQAYDPQPLKDNLKQKKDEATGGADKPAWFAHDKAPIPTMFALTQQIDKLNTDIKANRDQHDKQVADRNQALQDADKLEQQSESEKGQQSVDDYKKSSDLRRTGANLAADIDTTDAALAPLQHNLATAQAQQLVVAATIKSCDDQSLALDDSWKAIQGHMEETRQALKQIYDGTGASPRNGYNYVGEAGSGGHLEKVDAAAPAADSSQNGGEPLALVAKAQKLDTLVKEADALRAEAEASLDKAIKAFASAATAGAAMYSNDRNSSQVKENAALIGAYKLEMDALNGPVCSLRQANAEQTLAALYAQNAASLAARRDMATTLAATLQAGNLAVPAGLDADLTSAAADAAKNAEDHYTSANELFNNVIAASSAPADTKAAATAGRMILLYAWDASADPSGGHLKEAQGLAAGIDHTMLPNPPIALVPTSQPSNP